MKKHLILIMLLLIIFIGALNWSQKLENPFPMELDSQGVRFTIMTLTEELEILDCDINCPEFDFEKREAAKKTVLRNVFHDHDWNEKYKDVLVYGNDVVIESAPVRNGLFAKGQYLLFILSSNNSKTHSDFFANEEILHMYDDSTFVCYQSFDY